MILTFDHNTKDNRVYEGERQGKLSQKLATLGLRTLLLLFKKKHGRTARKMTLTNGTVISLIVQ